MQITKSPFSCIIRVLCITQKKSFYRKMPHEDISFLLFYPVKDFSWEKHCRVMMTMISLALLFYLVFPWKVVSTPSKDLLYEVSMFFSNFFLSTDELAVNFEKTDETGMMRRRKCTNLLPTYWLCTCVSVHLYWYISVYFMNLRTEPHGHVVNYSSHFSTSTRNFVVPAQLKSWRLHSLQRFRPRLHELHLMKSMLSWYHSKRSEHVSSPSCMFSCFSYIFVPDEVCAKVIMPKYLLCKHVPMPRLITSLTLILSSFFRQDYNMEQNTMKI